MEHLTVQCVENGRELRCVQYLEPTWEVSCRSGGTWVTKVAVVDEELPGPGLRLSRRLPDGWPVVVTGIPVLASPRR